MSEEAMLITPDFSEVQDPVEPGVYKVRVTDAETGKWEGRDGKPDTMYVKWQMETFDEQDPKNNGRKIWHRTPMNGGGAFRFLEFYKACMGQTFPKGEAFDPNSLFGKEIEVTVVEGIDRRTGQPTGYNDIKTVKPLS